MTESMAKKRRGGIGGLSLFVSDTIKKKHFRSFGHFKMGKFKKVGFSFSVF